VSQKPDALHCRRQRIGACPCGFIDDGTGFCVPQSNSCAVIGCNTDAECSGGSVCSGSRPDAGSGACTGVCVPRCRWDFVRQQLVAPGHFGRPNAPEFVMPMMLPASSRVVPFGEPGH
jgi:hypothetical protein